MIRQVILASILLSPTFASAVGQQDMPQTSCPTTSRYDPAKDVTETLDACTGKVLATTPLKAETHKAVAGAPAADSENADETKARADYNVWVYGFNRRIYEHQDWEGRVIFIVVNVLVMAGLYFAWVQFKTTLHISESIKSGSAEPRPSTVGSGTGAGAGLVAAATDPKTSESAGQAADPRDNDLSDSEFKLGKDGIAIRSSFIGLIILAFSMAFYLMYLKYVYPIHSAEEPDSKPVAAASIAAKK